MLTVIRREDYRPPAFRVLSVDLTFELVPEATLVTARLALERQGEGPLRLDGENLELVSITLNGTPLAAGSYTLDDTSLTIADAPDRVTLETVTRINPRANTVLEGLYLSKGLFCTQCEAEGFRRITYYPDRPDVLARFRTKVIGPKDTCPILLSNGNLVEEGELDGGRHYALWDDPFPKPSYLFALVAGDLGLLEDSYTTLSGKTVTLRLYTEPRDIAKCRHAMESLKKAMRWDEEVYGLEYDLDLFNIVAVRDFNMGAMENKSLNVFNSKLLLATPETATDEDHALVESVVAHEYFHNWTGNRVTCRDWFQLSLKEGLTVFRDQQFSADMGSAAVERINAVRFLRAHQFVEDDGPLAHPVRPDSYVEINNFYSVTVYEKGAEVIRMMHTLLGPEGFRKGMDLYFQRHDGQAVTCDDFASAMEDASGVDLTRFRLWYAQAGTPRITVSRDYDAGKREYRLDLRQTIPPTPGQPAKQPMHIPLRLGLIGADGRALPLKLSPDEAQAPEERVVSLTRSAESITLHDVPEGAVPSLLRGFSAPVKLDAGLSRAELAHLMRHDGDLFNRWEAGQQLAQSVLLERVRHPSATLDPLLEEAFAAILADKALDKALAAEALSLPSEEYLAQHMSVVDTDAVYEARQGVRRDLARRLEGQWQAAYEGNRSNEPYVFTAEAAGRRRLKNLALNYLLAADEREGSRAAMAQFRSADNMTDEQAALTALSHTGGAEREEALGTFYAKWAEDALVIDKWFNIQARADRAETLDEVKALLKHPAYEPGNPNRVRSLVAGFAANRKRFHDLSGDGYRFLAEQVMDIDKRNPRLSSRLVTAFESWRRFELRRRALMEAVLQEMRQDPELSKDLAEKVEKFLSAD